MDLYRGRTLSGKARLRKTALLVIAVGAIVAAGFTVPGDTEYLFSVKKNIEVFGRVYKEVATNYVDRIDPDRFMEAGIDGMLGSLDPYTTYIERGDGDEVDLLTNGKYGGIGVTIGMRDGALQVITVMDGYSAQRAGILPGDRLLQVDSVKVTGKKPDEVRGLTRGEPGTEVRLLVEREGATAPLEFILVRDEIRIRNVTYADFAAPGVGYVRLERFSRLAGEEVRQALKDLKLKGDVKGVILDLRGNPGGLLDAAVEVSSKFVPRNSLLVSTRGRRSEAEKEYRSLEEPVLPTIPLVVLIDRGSASASEIVAGSLQDLDRAVILGERSFGKGLVQTVLPLEYGAQLKVTTARYYIPSGRSIQEMDYQQRTGGEVIAFPDSTKKEFRTAKGRKVYEHGGITPDTTVADEDQGPMVRELNRKAMYFKFMNRYYARHNGEAPTGVTDQMMKEFRAFLDEEKFTFQEESETKLKELREMAERYHYGDEVVKDLDLLSAALAKEKERGFVRYRDHIEHGLRVELMSRVQGERGRIEASFPSDVQLQAAIGLLGSPQAFARRLAAR